MNSWIQHQFTQSRADDWWSAEVALPLRPPLTPPPLRTKIILTFKYFNLGNRLLINSSSQELFWNSRALIQVKGGKEKSKNKRHDFQVLISDWALQITVNVLWCQHIQNTTRSLEAQFNVMAGHKLNGLQGATCLRETCTSACDANWRST